ncbi:MAG: class I SAM-dependent methyltransferase [Lachnospiraceae bacterium]|nr:class I SAM-dependent methyltransferase [Lachnospiraceae bacterium]
MGADDKIYQMMYQRIPKVIEGKRVLEIATGPGLLAKEVAGYAKEMVATDYSEGMIREAKKGSYPNNLSFEVADATDLPYEDNSFDVVIIANALHIMPKPEKALSEIRRVLKDHGIFIAPNFVEKSENKRGDLWNKFLRLVGISFEHQWTKDQYENFLVTHGWRIVNSKEVVARLSLVYTENVKA